MYIWIPSNKSKILSVVHILLYKLFDVHVNHFTCNIVHVDSKKLVYMVCCTHQMNFKVTFSYLLCILQNFSSVFFLKKNLQVIYFSFGCQYICYFITWENYVSATNNEISITFLQNSVRIIPHIFFTPNIENSNIFFNKLNNRNTIFYGKLFFSYEK